jgi:hypothetical protein
MRTTPLSETDAQQVSRRALLPAGWHNGRIVEAVEKPSRRGNDMIEIAVIVPAAADQIVSLRAGSR